VEEELRPLWPAHLGCHGEDETCRRGHLLSPFWLNRDVVALNVLVTAAACGEELVTAIAAEEDGVLKRLLSLRQTRRTAGQHLCVRTHLRLLMR
jgi:hypothetical protein